MALQDSIDALKATVAQETTVEASAVALLNGLSAQLAAALAAAANAGATADQLQALTDLNTQIGGDTAALSAAVTANTAPTPPSP